MNRVNQIVAKVLRMSPEQITDETSPGSVENWDSFNGLMLVSELESEFNVRFTMDEVVSVKCVKDIKEALKKHGINP